MFKFSRSHVKKAQLSLCFFLVFSFLSQSILAQSTIVDSLLNELDVSKKKDDKETLIIIYNEIGSNYEQANNFEKALLNYLEALKIAEDIGDVILIGKIKMNLSYLYFNQNDNGKILPLAKDAQHIFHREGEAVLEGMAFNIIGQAHQNMKMLDSAMIYYNKALVIFNQHAGPSTKSVLLTCIGALYQEMENYPKAIAYYEESLAIDDSLGNMKNVAISYANIASIYDNMNDFKKAIEFFEKSLEITQTFGEIQFLMTTTLYLSEAYYNVGEYKKAFEYRTQYMQYKDSIFSETKSEQFLFIQEEFEAEKKEQEIVTLKLDKDVLEAKNSLNNILLYGSLGLLVLVIVIVLLYVKQRKAKELQNRANLEQRALRAQMNPHFIFNSLNSIQRMFIEGKNDIANDYMGDFGELLRIILENSGKSTISIKDELDALKLYIDLEMMRTDELITYELNIDLEIDQLNNFVPPLIIQPFVENAIWHGILPTEKKGKISIDIKQETDELLLCTIADNGVGIEQSKKQKEVSKHKSRGMQITEERLNAPNAIVAKELASGGTKITVLIPLNK